MRTEIIDVNGRQLTRVHAGEEKIKELGDMLDIMGNAVFNGSNRIIIDENCLSEDFFDLSSGLAGEILQKFSTYDAYLAIIGDFSKYRSKSLKDFISESNRYGRIRFVSSFEEAVEKLAK